jgi:kanamycin kinase
MDAEDWPDLEHQRSLGDEPIPRIVIELAAGSVAEFVWRNQLGGLTFRIGDRFVKWNPHGNGIDLSRERVRLDWISRRHLAPRVLDAGVDEHGQWLLTTALPGDHAIGDTWRARRSEAIHAIASGLRAIHAVPIDDFPSEWTAESWVSRARPEIGPRPQVVDPVVVHGDACAPNTLISADGNWVGNVDFGDLSIGDRWADLAIASMSLDWNFGEGHQQELFDTYGVEPDPLRIHYYRRLWYLES